MTPDVVWCTSLPPRGDAAAQTARVLSWGGRVVSFNDAEEAACLSFPAAERVTVARSGRRGLGKPVPFLDDILEWQAAAAQPVAGIVNADIAFEATAGERRFLAGLAAAGTLVCIRRTDVPDEETPLLHGTQLPQGFDAFLYPRGMAPVLRADGLCLGMPFWDLWLPLAAVLAGRPVAMVRAPLARHVAHPVAWNAAAPVFMHLFVQAALAAAASAAPSVAAAMLTHQLAAYRALTDLAAEDEAAAVLLNRLYDDFQSRVLTAVEAVARPIDDISAAALSGS
jgi:hypothetical protein